MGVEKPQVKNRKGEVPIRGGVEGGNRVMPNKGVRRVNGRACLLLTPQDKSRASEDRATDKHVKRMHNAETTHLGLKEEGGGGDGKGGGEG